MAKVKGGLFALGASGAVGKTLVYFGWKGLDVVREYVVPTNPKSIAQRTQRGHLTDAVTEFHAALYDDNDMTAWNRLALIAAKVMTGFNIMVKSFIDEIILGNTWERLRNGSASVVHTTGFDVHIWKTSTGNRPTVHYGTSKSWMPGSLELVDYGSDHWSNSITGLTKNTLYYYYFTVGTSATDYGRTGIYQQKTFAE